jgi:DNA-binding NarL/FixJ family response regulator
MGKTVRVLIVDDQALFAEGLRYVFTGTATGIDVVGIASDGEEALALTAEKKPDVVLMDVRMPGLDGIAALTAIKRIAARTSVIMVTLYDDPDYLIRAVCAGASGYILKDSSREELVRTVRVTAEGGAIVSPRLLPQLLSRVSQAAADERTAQHRPIGELSEREKEVLLLLAEGCTWAEIRAKLDCGDSYISRWSKRFEAERLAGLFARHAGRERYKVTERLEARVLAWTTRRKPADGSTHWSSRKLAA